MAVLGIASWNLGGLTGDKILELTQNFAGDHVLSRIQVFMLQEVITEVELFFASRYKWTLIYGKREGAWRGEGILYHSSLGLHHHSRAHMHAVSTTIRSHHSKIKMKLIAAHLPHHATTEQTTALAAEWGEHMPRNKIWIGIDANETFTTTPGGLDYLWQKGYRAEEGGTHPCRHQTASDHDAVWSIVAFNPRLGKSTGPDGISLEALRVLIQDPVLGRTAQHLPTRAGPKITAPGSPLTFVEPVAAIITAMNHRALPSSHDRPSWPQFDMWWPSWAVERTELQTTPSPPQGRTIRLGEEPPLHHGTATAEVAVGPDEPMTDNNPTAAMEEPQPPRVWSTATGTTGAANPQPQPPQPIQPQQQEEGGQRRQRRADSHDSSRSSNDANRNGTGEPAAQRGQQLESSDTETSASAAAGSDSPQTTHTDPWTSISSPRLSQCSDDTDQKQPHKTQPPVTQREQPSVAPPCQPQPAPQELPSSSMSKPRWQRARNRAAAGPQTDQGPERPTAAPATTEEAGGAEPPPPQQQPTQADAQHVQTERRNSGGSTTAAVGDAKRVNGEFNLWLLSLGQGRVPRTMPPELPIAPDAFLHTCALSNGGAWAAVIMDRRDARGPAYFSGQDRPYAIARQERREGAPGHTGYLATGMAMLLLPLGPPAGVAPARWMLFVTAVETNRDPAA
ncbi:unnamed protein product [Symbiodinium sp. CCMP2592]|nr:unnamed protein product [Symbiodinium sp. CCMP2592]